MIPGNFAQWFLALGLLLVPLLSACKKDPPPQTETDVLATVGATKIRIADLEHEWERRRSLNRPTGTKEALLREMVRDETLVQQARRLGIDEDEEIQRSIRNLLIGTLKERELSSKLKELKVTDEDLRAAYEQDRASFQRGEMLHLAMILISKPRKATTAKLAVISQRAQAALVMAQPSFEGFVQTAAKFSDHQSSRYRGGDQGWIDPERPPAHLPPAVAVAALDLADGATSEIIETDLGHFIIKRLASRPASMIPFEQAKLQLQSKVLAQKRLETHEAFEKEAGSEIEVALDLELLKKVALAEPSPKEEEPPPAPTP